MITSLFFHSCCDALWPAFTCIFPCSCDACWTTPYCCNACWATLTCNFPWCWVLVSCLEACCYKMHISVLKFFSTLPLKSKALASPLFLIESRNWILWLKILITPNFANNLKKFSTLSALIKISANCFLEDT